MLSRMRNVRNTTVASTRSKKALEKNRWPLMSLLRGEECIKKFCDHQVTLKPTTSHKYTSPHFNKTDQYNLQNSTTKTLHFADKGIKATLTHKTSGKCPPSLATLINLQKIFITLILHTSHRVHWLFLRLSILRHQPKDFHYKNQVFE